MIVILSKAKNLSLAGPRWRIETLRPFAESILSEAEGLRATEDDSLGAE